MEITKGDKIALVFGATGLVGSHVVQLLLEHPAYARVRAFSRRPIDLEHDKLEIILVNYDRLDRADPAFREADDVYLCLGTTRAKAGSDEAFRRVDFTYAFDAAKRAALHGANQIMVVSSVGADPDSRLLYFRTKGELELAIRKLPYWAVHIFRPSTLVGDWQERRWGEAFAKVVGRGLNWVSGGRFNSLRPIAAQAVAQAMVDAAQRLTPGFQLYDAAYLHRSADQRTSSLMK